MSCRRSPPFCGPGAGAPRGLSFEQCVDLGRTHDGPVTHKGLVVVLDAVMVVEVVDHDAEGFLDAAWRVVAEPIDTFEPRAVAEVKARYRVDAYRGSPRQIAGAKPQQGCAQLVPVRPLHPARARAAAAWLWPSRAPARLRRRSAARREVPDGRMRSSGGRARDAAANHPSP